MIRSIAVIESPYGTNPDGSRADGATVAENERYLNRAILDCLNRGIAPYASHGFFPRVLDDAKPAERETGILAGFAIGRVLAAAGAARIFYMDRGMTPGMKRGLDEGDAAGQPLHFWRLGVKS